MTDVAFKTAIDVVSEHERLAWTSRYLFYEIAGWIRRRQWAVRLTRRPYVRLDWAFFEDMLERWHSVHGPSRRMIRRRAFAEPPSDENDTPDLADYSFQRLVVCADEAFVDFLLANSFHAENRVPVFSAAGYPEQVFARLEPALGREPPDVIVVVHNADSEGCALAAQVAEDPRWVGTSGGVRVVDAGLRPDDAKRFRGAFLPGTPLETAGGVTDSERRWLARYRLELEALGPRSTLRRLAKIVQTPLDELLAEAKPDDRIITTTDLWIAADVLGGGDYSG